MTDITAVCVTMKKAKYATSTFNITVADVLDTTLLKAFLSCSLAFCAEISDS